MDIGQLNVKQPPDVEDNAAWQIVVPVEITSGIGEGLEPDLYLDLMVIREGNTVATMTTTDVLDELDPALRDKLAATMAGRMSESSTTS